MFKGYEVERVAALVVIFHYLVGYRIREIRLAYNVPLIGINNF
jgi:hypothetical protein